MAMGPRRWGASLMVVKMAVGPSAPPMMPREHGQLEVAQHGAEVGQSAHTHEDDGRQEAALDEGVVEIVHQAQVVGDLMERHLIDVLHHGDAVHGDGDEALGVGLQHAHAAAGEVGDEHAEGDGHEQQRLVFLHDAQIEQHEGQEVHHEEQRILADGRERRHVVQLGQNIIKHFHS